MTRPKPLSDAQRVILAAAAARDDGAALPLPPSLKARGAAATALLSGLLAKQLLAEGPAPAGAPLATIWREPEDGGERVGLAITTAGRHAIGVEDTDAHAEIVSAGSAASLPAATTGKPAAAGSGAESKQARVVAMLRRPGGATLDELVTATGWQRHTVRGAIAGALKKKLGLPILAEKRAGDGARAYRIADETSPTGAETETSAESAA